MREKDSDCFRESVSVVLLHVVGGGERKAASTTKNICNFYFKIYYLENPFLKELNCILLINENKYSSVFITQPTLY